MNRFLVNKLCLGTAQFGTDYGIANPTGKVGKEEVIKILKYASYLGVDFLDTAHSYGHSEKVLGEFIENNKPGFKVVSKLPPLTDKGVCRIETLFFESLADLKLDKLYGYLIHKFDDYLSCKEVWAVLRSLKRKGLVKKIGFSLYNPCELERLFSEKVEFDIIQVPYSIFDRRFSGNFEALRANGVEIYVRSVFLQGLAFLALEDLPAHLAGAKKYLLRLRSIAAEKNISVNAICLNFALLNPYVDKVVIGVDSLKQLEKNLQDTGLADRVSSIIDGLDDLRIDNEDILLPYKWTGGRK